MRKTVSVLLLSGLLLATAGYALAKNKKDKKVDQRDKSGETPLMKAASAGDTDTVKALLTAGADVSEKDALGETAMAKAAVAGHADVLKLLLDAGGSRQLDKDCKKYCNPLITAAQNGYTDVVKLLLDAGANKEVSMFYSTSFTTTMHVADLGRRSLQPGQTFTGSAYGAVITVTMTQPEAGGDIFIVHTGAIPETALTMAAMQGHIDVVKILLAAGANRNGHDALYIGQITPTRFGLSNYTFFSDHENALEAAKQGKHQDIVDLLTATATATAAAGKP
jgi:ankyrin repeat protein